MGFFDDIPEQKKQKKMSCASCGLYANVKSPRIEPYGEFEKRVMVVGDFLDKEDDNKGCSFQNQDGRALQAHLRKLGFSLFKDCLCTTAVQCYAEEVDSKHVASCRARLLNQIKEAKPHVVILFGDKAVESIIGNRWQRNLGSIFKWRGWTIPDRELNAWVCPVFHPRMLSENRKEVETIFKQDLERALSMLQRPLPRFEDDKKKIQIIEDLSILQTLKSPTAFDYETTSLKPQSKEQKIYCMSVCDSEDVAYGFMMPEKGTKNFKRVVRFLSNPNVTKCGQNIKFEDSWTFVQCGVQVQGWVWDAMLATHILDNRQDITGLKFQSLVQFGITDYDSEVHPYLMGTEDKNANSINRIHELIKTKSGKEKLLIYCGLDSLYERKLCVQQMKEFGRFERLKQKEAEDAPPWD